MKRQIILYVVIMLSALLLGFLVAHCAEDTREKYSEEHNQVRVIMGHTITQAEHEPYALFQDRCRRIYLLLTQEQTKRVRAQLKDMGAEHD